MKKLIYILIFTFAFLFGSYQCGYAQTKDSTEKQLSDCSQILDQSISEVRACKDKAVAYLAEITALRAKDAISDKEILYYQELVKKLDARIEYLEKKKCTEIKILWILFRMRWC